MTFLPASPSACKTPNRPSRRTSAAAFHGTPPEPDDPLLGFPPYIHKAPRRNSITPERQRAFIATLAATGIVTQAARAIGASLEALYSLRSRKGAEGFAEAWEEALDRGVARLEDCALERAIQGEERVFLNRAGDVVARWTRYDTALIVFLLRQRRADRFSSGSSFASLRPGHPVHDRLRREWLREEQAKRHAQSEEILLSINRKLEAIRQRAIVDGEIEPANEEERRSALAAVEARREAEERGEPEAGKPSAAPYA